MTKLAQRYDQEITQKSTSAQNNQVANNSKMLKQISGSVRAAKG